MNQFMTPATIHADTIRYIKLGQGGCWEASSLDGNKIDWGAEVEPHDLAVRGAWDAVRAHYLERGYLSSTATGYTNEEKAFYDRDTRTLWISFARGCMWWAFAHSDVHAVGGNGIDHGARHRKTRNGWSNRDINGDILYLDRLSTRLTKLASYPRTMCKVSETDLCLRYINASDDTDSIAVNAARDHLEQVVLTLIQRLGWSDFELLCDMMLTRSGWRRISELGGTLKDVDLVMEQPLTGERLIVQVKSSAGKSTLGDYEARFANRPVNERFLLICHSPTECLADTGFTDSRPLQLMAGRDIARRAIGCDLTDWILSRAR